MQELGNLFLTKQIIIRNNNSGNLKIKPGKKATLEQLKKVRIQIAIENRR